MRWWTLEKNDLFLRDKLNVARILYNKVSRIMEYTFLEKKRQITAQNESGHRFIYEILLFRNNEKNFESY